MTAIWIILVVLGVLAVIAWTVPLRRQTDRDFDQIRDQVRRERDRQDALRRAAATEYGRRTRNGGEG